jgi:hypothetical protein
LSTQTNAPSKIDWDKVTQIIGCASVNSAKVRFYEAKKNAKLAAIDNLTPLNTETMSTPKRKKAAVSGSPAVKADEYDAIDTIDDIDEVADKSVSASKKRKRTVAKSNKAATGLVQNTGENVLGGAAMSPASETEKDMPRKRASRAKKGAAAVKTANGEDNTRGYAAIAPAIEVGSTKSVVADSGVAMTAAVQPVNSKGGNAMTAVVKSVNTNGGFAITPAINPMVASGGFATTYAATSFAGPVYATDTYGDALTLPVMESPHESFDLLDYGIYHRDTPGHGMVVANAVGNDVIAAAEEAARATRSWSQEVENQAQIDADAIFAQYRVFNETPIPNAEDVKWDEWINLWDDSDEEKDKEKEKQKSAETKK